MNCKPTTGGFPPWVAVAMGCLLGGLAGVAVLMREGRCVEEGGVGTMAWRERGRHHGDIGSDVNDGLMAVSWGGEDTRFISDVMSWSEARIRRCLTSMIESPQLDPRERDLGELLIRRWIELNPDGFYGWWVKSKFAFECREVTEQLFSTWVRLSPVAATQAAMALQSTVMRKWAIEAMISYLAKEDPELAFELARADGGHDGVLLGSVMSNWAVSDPRSAIAKALDEKDQNLRKRWVVGVIEQVANMDGGRALALVDEVLKPGRLRDEAIGAIALKLAQKTPLEGLQLLKETGSQEVRNAYMWSLVRSWASADPDEALEWAQTLPNGPGRWRAYQLAGAAMIQKGSGDINEMLFMMPSRSLQDALIRDVTLRVSSSDPRWTVEWAESIDDARIRTVANRAAFSGLAIQKPEEAVRYAAEHMEEVSQDGRIAYAIRALPSAAPEARTLILSLPEQSREVFVNGWLRKHGVSVSEADRTQIERIVGTR